MVLEGLGRVLAGVIMDWVMLGIIEEGKKRELNTR
jgi:hypothetical protein